MDLIERLRRVPLFEHLSEDDLRRVAEIAEERDAPAGTRLSRQADLGATLFIIDAGEAVIRHVDEHGHQRPAGMLRAGEWYGATSLFLGEPRDATVVAVTPMRLWTIRRVDFQQLLDENPQIQSALHIPDDILHRLRAPRYPWQEPGELVLYANHRHWLVFAQTILLTTVVLLGYVVLMTALTLAGRMRSNMAFASLIAAGLYSFVFGWRWMEWSNDYFVVTTRRVTHHEQTAFLYESREEAPLDRVQNIKIERGIWGSLFNYGTLTIETAAQVGRMFLTMVPRPERVSEAILSQINRARATRRAAQRQLIRQELAKHMNLEISEPPAETQNGAADPLHAIAEAAAVKVQPSRLARALIWLANEGLFPATRIDKPDAIIWRKHWLFLLADDILPFLLSILFGVIAVAGLFGFPRWLVSAFVYYPYIALFLMILCMGSFWWESSEWTNDTYMVTDERILDVFKHPLFFAEERREANLGVIQNVSLEIPNFLAATFNYGDVIVQTAGAGEFIFKNVSAPHEVQREIFRRMEAYREAQREKEAATRRAEMAEWFSVYDELRHEKGLHTAPPAGQDTPSLEHKTHVP
jgi:uncharacterized membrane protein YdbT with pleckstrin-like domain